MPTFFKKITYLIVFLFPALTNLVNHGGSTILSVLTLFGIYAWLTKTTSPSFDRSERLIMWTFAIYFFTCFIYFIAFGLFSENTSFHWNLDHEIRMLAFIPIYFLFYRTGLKSWTLWYGTSVAAIISGIYGIIYIYVLAAGPRATNAYEPIEFGIISLVLGFISLSGIRYFYEKNKYLTIIPLLALFSGNLACFLSGTRMGFLTIPFLTLIFFFQLGTFRRPWLYRSMMIFAMLLTLAVSYNLPKSSLKNRLQAGIADAKPFFNGKDAGPYAVHLGLWTEGWKIYKTSPLLGIGRDGYNKAIKQKLATNQISPEIAQFSTPHNIYLIKMIAYGILGLFILLAIFVSPLILFIHTIKTNEGAKDFAYAGIMLIVGFMFFGISEHIFKRNITIAFYIIMLAMIIALTKQVGIDDITASRLHRNKFQSSP